MQAHGLKMRQRVYRAWNGAVVILDDDGTKIRAYINGREAAYLSYSIEDEGRYQVISFGYIHVQPAFQSTKLSSLLLFCLAGEALARGIPVVRVVKPDPGLAGYWEHIGFDIRAAKRNLYFAYRGHLANVPEPTAEDLRDTVAIFADGPAGRILRLNQAIASSYWEIETDAASVSGAHDWYKRQKETLVGFNMYEGQVKPLHDYSSSYIS